MEKLSKEMHTEMSHPEQQEWLDLDDRVPPPVSFPVNEQMEELHELLDSAKTEFEVDDAIAVFSTWRIETDGQSELNARLTDERAAEICKGLPKGEYMLKIKFLRENTEGQWVIEDKFDPIKTEKKKGQRIVEINQDTKPGTFVGIDKVFYQNAYPVTAAVYGIYPIRDPHPDKLAPMRDGTFNCVAQRVVEHFECALRGYGLTAKRRLQIQEWEQKVHTTGATVSDVAKLESILQRSIVLRDIAGEDIFNSGKYQKRGNKTYSKVELIYHNGHAWSKELHFPPSREVHFYDGDIWEAIKEATQDTPLAVWLLGSSLGEMNRTFNVTQFVLPDGRTYRTQEFHNHLKQVCKILGDESLADQCFGENHAASVMAIQKNTWKPTPGSCLDDIQKACVEHGHGGLWNANHYDTKDVFCIDMKSCYPASMQGMGEAKPYFERFGHPTHHMTRVSINGPLPIDIGTGFAEVEEWEFNKTCHPVIPAWYGKHFASQGWAPTALLAFLVESGLLTKLKIREVIVSYEKQTKVWLPESRNQGCSIIGKFTQGCKADCKRLTRRLVTNQGELDFLVRDTRQNGTLVGAPEKCPLGHILTYHDGSQPQYTHLRASMLAYAHINLLTMLQRFTSDEAVRVATDSIYVQKAAMYKLRGVEAFVETHTEQPVAQGQWRDKGEHLQIRQPDASYSAKPEFIGQTKDLIPSTAPRYDDPLTRHQLSYLNGGGGSGKTTRAIELFRERNPLLLTPTHRLAKEMRTRDVKAQTYHSFFRWSGQADWTPDRMGQKYIPRVIIWDEICTVPRPILERFLDWLCQKGVQVICCGDQGQPPPIAGEMPHGWLKVKADYYEEVTADYRAKDEELKDLKKHIRLKDDKVQCQEMRKTLPSCLTWDQFVQEWNPHDLILASRQKVRDRAQQLLIQRHKEHFSGTPVPILYHPKDGRKQNIMVTIPGTDEKEKLVLNDVVDVTMEAAEQAVQTPDWRLAYALTIHSSQGLTIQNPQRVWILDDYLQWSNLVYLAVSRVERINQLQRVKACLVDSEEKPQTNQELRTVIAKKLVAYKKQDQKKGLKGFNLKVSHVLELKNAQGNRCAACNIKMLWAYEPKDMQQFSVDRLDNSKGHTHENIRLTCWECNRKRGAATH